MACTQGGVRTTENPVPWTVVATNPSPVTVREGARWVSVEVGTTKEAG